MRILFVGSQNLKFRGERYYHPGAKLFNGLVRAGHNVFWMSDRDVARSATPLGVKAVGHKYTNRYFIDSCRNFQPEMIIFYHADIITVESIREARAMLSEVKIAQFNVDPIFRPHNMAMLREKLDVVDGAFITTAGPELKRFSNPHSFVSFVPNAVDASIEWPECHKHSNQEFDVFWAARPAKTFDGDPRYDLPKAVYEDERVAMQYFGMDKPIVYDASYYRALANSKMGLNISVDRDVGVTDKARPEELYLYSSDRISHYMGSGLLTFITRGFSLEEMFEEDKEAVYFQTQEELLDKVLFYKKNDAKRKKIAAAAHKKSHEQLNSTLIAQYMVEMTMGGKLSQSYAWPTDKY